MAMNDRDKLPRIEFRKILYTTDLSESGRQAFPYAAAIANRCDAELTVYHVVESKEFEKYLVGYVNEDLWEEIKTRNLQDARELLVKRKRSDARLKDEVDRYLQSSMPDAEDARPYVTYDVVVDTGDPVDKIIEFAETGGFDLVVIGKHGHRALREALMGDTARRVTRRCRVPVLVVQVPGDDED